jgi:hypothetical protein
MDLTPIRIENDILLDKMIETMIPLVNKNNTLELFWQANGIGKSSEKQENKKILHSVFCTLYSAFSIIESMIRKFWLPHTLGSYKKL